MVKNKSGLMTDAYGIPLGDSASIDKAWPLSTCNALVAEIFIIITNP